MGNILISIYYKLCYLRSLDNPLMNGSCQSIFTRLVKGRACLWTWAIRGLSFSLCAPLVHRHSLSDTHKWPCLTPAWGPCVGLYMEELEGGSAHPSSFFFLGKGARVEGLVGWVLFPFKGRDTLKPIGSSLVLRLIGLGAVTSASSPLSPRANLGSTFSSPTLLYMLSRAGSHRLAVP